MTSRPAFVVLALLLATAAAVPPSAAAPRQGLPAMPELDQVTAKRVFVPLAQKYDAPPPTDPTTADLIEAARRRGQISDETALLYRVYDEFADNRLPDNLRGRASLPSSPLDEAASRWDGISASTQTLLEPFFVPPSAIGSWYGLSTVSHDLRPTLAVAPTVPQSMTLYLDSRNGKVRIWYETATEQAIADTVRQAIDDTIYPLLTGYMGREPIDDLFWVPWNGGDGRLDIYLVNSILNASTLPFLGIPAEINNILNPFFKTCRTLPSASYMQVPAKLAQDRVLENVAHEFLHVLQNSYPTKECAYPNYEWLAESTAVWAEKYVYPRFDFAHEAVPAYFGTPEVAMDGGDKSRKYGTYTFFYFVWKQLGNEKIVRQAWENASGKSEREAVDSALANGFRDAWPQFVAAWPNDEASWWRFPLFRDDRLSDKMKLGFTVEAVPDVNRGHETYGDHGVAMIDAKVNSLAARAYRFQFSSETARSITFENPFGESPDPNAKLQAYYRIDDRWQGPFDWTAQRDIRFCRDARAERLQELIVLISNGSVEKDKPLAPSRTGRLVVTNIGCWRWKGTATTSFPVDSDDRKTNETLTTKVTFERDSVTSDGSTRFRVLDGSVDWAMASGYITLNGNRCNVEPTTMSIALRPPNEQGQSYLQVYNYSVNSRLARRYLGSGIAIVDFTWISSCANDYRFRCGAGLQSWLITEQPASLEFNHFVETNGAIKVNGFQTTVMTSENWTGRFRWGTATYTWDLKPERQ